MAAKKAGTGSSAADQYKTLIAKAEDLRETAKSDFLSKVNDAVKGLKELGFSYELREKTGAKEATKGAVADKSCPICKFKTDPPHDSRAHRGQGEKPEDKKRFTAAELTERGLKKVD